MTFFCAAQSAGPLTIASEALRPRFPEGGKPSPQAMRYQRCAVNRWPVDRLEARLALIGWGAWQYTLTFDDRWLPEKYRGVQKSFGLFRKRVAYWRRRCGQPADWMWAAAIEGKHGDHRWHVHFVCDGDDFNDTALEHAWRYGEITDSSPVLKDRQGFFRLARYLNKESRDGWIIPIGAQAFSCSRALASQVPQPERWEAQRREVAPPSGAICIRTGVRGDDDEPIDNGFGVYWRTEWLTPDWSPSCRRAMIRMGYEREVFAHEAQLRPRARAREQFLQLSGK